MYTIGDGIALAGLFIGVGYVIVACINNIITLLHLYTYNYKEKILK